MDAIEFIKYYNQFISEIEQGVKPEYKSHLDKFRSTDPKFGKTGYIFYE